MTQLPMFSAPPHVDPCIGCSAVEVTDGRTYCGALVGRDVTRAQKAAAWVLAGMNGACDARKEKR